MTVARVDELLNAILDGAGGAITRVSATELAAIARRAIERIGKQQEALRIGQRALEAALAQHDTAIRERDEARLHLARLKDVRDEESEYAD